MPTDTSERISFTLTLEEKKTVLAASLAGIRDPQKRLAWLIARNADVPPMPPGLKIDANRVPGCLTKLWLVKEMRLGQCQFRSDSDSKIVRAVAGLICDVYSDQSPGDILSFGSAFLGELGIKQLLTQNRQNGLSRLWEEIRGFADAQASPRVSASPGGA